LRAELEQDLGQTQLTQLRDLLVKLNDTNTVRQARTPGNPRIPGKPAAHNPCGILAPGRADMSKLIYSAITSLDGYVEDTNGNFDWAAPDPEHPPALRSYFAGYQFSYFTKYQFSGLMDSVGDCGRAPLRSFATSVIW